MIRNLIKKVIEKTLKEEKLPKIKVEINETPDEKFGDYSTNVALKLSSRGIKHSPTEIAKKLVPGLEKSLKLPKIEIAGTGFINFYLEPKLIQNNLRNIIEEDKDFGSADTNKGKKARVEFISANPTGPLHIGNARGGPLGDAIANVLESSGFDVLREYINNDRGNQVKELGRTLAVHAGYIEKGDKPLTYIGEYTTELAKKIKNKLGDIKGLSEKEIVEKAGEVGVKIMFEEIMGDVAAMGIKFGLVVDESKLQEELPNVLKQLESKRLLKKHEGALWFAPRDEFLKDKDAVVVKSDGSYTYFGADIVYHKDKLESGYDLVVDVFGSNTFGHVPKLQALVKSLGFDLNKLKFILYQFVMVKRGKDIVRMSKRAGNYVTAREVIDEVGKDAFRFFLLSHSPNTHMDFDLEQAKQKNESNPVFYVQYAHARASNILKNSHEKLSSPDLSLLSQPQELKLMKKLIKFPELTEDISESLAVHQLTTYSIEVADLFHKYYERYRVIGEEKELMKARLNLVLATKIVLRNTLSLLGVSAPERM